MGAAKEMWMAEIDRVCDEFTAEKMKEAEAIKELRRLGFDQFEAADMILEIQQ